MEFREITKEVSIPILGLGTWGMGGRETPDKARDSDTITAIRMAVELGLTHIDTAEYYGAGHAEELVGVEQRHGHRRADALHDDRVRAGEARVHTGLCG